MTPYVFWDSTNLVQSGSYLPISVSLWGTANNAYLDWANTVELVSVQAFQNNQALEDSQFTILSNNNEAYFDDFAHTSAVPIPPTILLLASGLIGLAGLRRKFKN